MKWPDTVASKCRYGEIAGRIWGSWEVLWEDSVKDWQGWGKFFAKKGKKKPRYVYYEWTYGSCSGCDTWEYNGMSRDDIEAEMRSGALWLKGKAALKVWLKMLERTGKKDIEGLLEAIRSEVREERGRR